MNKSRKGFSLLEVLIALGILTLVLTAVLKMQIKSTELSRQSILGFETLVVAVDHLEELMAGQFIGISETTEEPYAFNAKTDSVTKIYSFERLKLIVKRPDLSPLELSVYRLK